MYLNENAICVMHWSLSVMILPCHNLSSDKGRLGQTAIDKMPLLKIPKHKMLPNPKLVCYFTSIFAHKINNFLSRPFIYKGFKTNNRFSFRDKHLLVYHTDKLRYKVSITYNALPLLLRSKEKLKTFKSLLYDQILST